MTNRYKHTPSQQRRFKQTVYAIPGRSFQDRYIISREGDRLDLLAVEFYQDSRMWWILAEANELGKGTFAVPPGIQLRIPTINKSDISDGMLRAQQEK